MAKWTPSISCPHVNAAFEGRWPIECMAGDDDRHRSNALRVGSPIVLLGVPNAGPAMRVDLRQSCEVVTSEVLSGFAHRID